MKDENKSGKNAPEHSDEPYVPTNVDVPTTKGTTPAEPIEFDGIETAEMHNKHLKERLEKERGSIIIKYEELINIAPEFAIWLKSIIRYGNVDSQVLIFWDIKQAEKDGGNHFRCIFYTDTHKYSIYGYKSSDRSPKGYLGCGGDTRKPRPGEDWHRGNDLPDGKYSKKTFDAIVRGIVAYELKSLQLWRK